jgi:hypothetical protein
MIIYFSGFEGFVIKAALFFHFNNQIFEKENISARGI